MKEWDIIVVGGGAAGMMAAGHAARAGSRVLLLERMSRPGRKLRITGKGRCNLTNTAERHDFLEHFGCTGPSLRQAFARCFTQNVMRFFEGLGVSLITERGGRVFPASGKATDVVDALVSWVSSHGVTIHSSARADGLIVESGQVRGVKVGRQRHCASSVILATGGASYPGTGSSGDGYRLASSVGHSLVPIRPALVPLELSEPVLLDLAGLNLRNVGMRVLTDGKCAAAYFGELHFMKYGVSGPVVLTASGAVVDALLARKRVTLSLDLKPALNADKLEKRLLRDFAERGKEPMNSVLRGLLPKPLVRPCLSAAGIQKNRLGSSINAGERKRMLTWLKDFRLTVKGHRPLSEAIVTAGGVDMAEVNPKTMESRIVKGLYCVGELLNVHADTGGYNLQAAFTTGWVAGVAASGLDNRGQDA